LDRDTRSFLARDRVSSLLLGVENVTDKRGEPGRIQWSVDRKFSTGSTLNFIAFVYNAGRPAGVPPDVTVRAAVLRDGREDVATSPAKITVDTKGDAARERGSPVR
jgi:hypothetical protein